VAFGKSRPLYRIPQRNNNRPNNHNNNPYVYKRPTLFVFPKIMFAGTVTFGFSLKVETYNEPADLRLSTSLAGTNKLFAGNTYRP
jgi:hypothetical protein